MMSSPSNQCDNENSSPSKINVDHEKEVLSDQSVAESGKPPLSLHSEEGTGRPITPTAQAHLVPVREMPVGSYAGTARAVTAIKGMSVIHIAGAGLAPQLMTFESVADMSQPMHPEHNVIEKYNDGERSLATGAGSKATRNDDSESDSEQLLVALREAVQYTTNNKAKSKELSHANPSQRTQEDYLKKYDRFVRSFENAQGAVEDRVTSTFLPFASSKNSFSAMRSGVKFTLRRKLAAFIKDAAASLSQKGKESQQGKEIAERVKRDIEILRALDQLDRMELLEREHQKTRAVRSKKRQLSLLNDSWKDRFLIVNKKSATYRDAGVLLRFCGLRPEELKKGVDVVLNGSNVFVRIKGAKVREGISGQKWRIVGLEANHLPQEFLEKLKTTPSLTVRVSSEGLRQHLKRLTEAVLGNLLDGDRRRVWLSAYLFRHALVSDLRSDGWDEQSIAAVLGEAATDTARQYGKRSRSKSTRPLKIAIQRSLVQTAVPVRPTKKKSGYTQVARTKKQKILS